MEVLERASASQTPSVQPEALDGFRRLRTASVFGLLAQVLIWGSALALWIVGSLYSSIPVSTSIAYGANGFSVSAGEIFALNFVLIAGAGLGLIASVLSTRALRGLSKAPPRFSADGAVALTTLGSIGFGLFAVGWALWLGSFVAPGWSGNGYSPDYTPVLASSLADVVNLVLILGGLLAFGGMVGILAGASKLGPTYDETAIELGGALSVLPLFSIIGCLLMVIGLRRVQRKLEGGWSPPPTPPPPAYPPAAYPGPIYPVSYASGPQGSWDSLAAVLVVVLVLLWVFILPFSFVFLASNSVTHGPGNTPGGNVSAAPAASSSSGLSAVAILLAGLVATALIVPLAVVRNRRKRQRLATQSAPPPPPPAQPPPPVRENDPLDHLV